MKRFAASILLFLYFVVNTGFVISVHYCMDEVDGVELGNVSNNECDKCGMLIEDNDGCCKDEVKVIKMEVDQLTVKLVSADFYVPLLASSTISSLFTPGISKVYQAEPVAHGPPLSDQYTYLQNCVFRI